MTSCATISNEKPRNSLQKGRSEEHTSELQSQSNLVCRLLLEKKKNILVEHQATAANTSLAPTPGATTAARPPRATTPGLGRAFSVYGSVLTSLDLLPPSPVDG